MGCMFDGRGSIPNKEGKFLSAQQCQDRLWDPTTLLFRWVARLLSRVYTGGSVKLITHINLVPMSQIFDLYLHFPLRLHGAVCNYTTKTEIMVYTGRSRKKDQYTGRSY
jgi:hypothetical protein